MKDYSQAGEQEVILRAFEEKPVEAKRFLDIGAWNATDKSNTRALFEIGWSGVMIEPSPGPMHGLLAEYGNEPRVTLIISAVSLEPGLVKLIITDDAVSSPGGAHFETWKDSAKFIGSMLIPAITLDQIFNQFGGFDFVNIDAEGVSADLFLHMLGMGIFPTCVCVEHDGRTTALLDAASKLNYAGKVIGANLIVWR